MPIKKTHKGPILTSDQQTVVTALHRAMVASLTEDTWRELGHATNTFDWIREHPRLLKSCHFEDTDYPRHAKDALEHMLLQDPSNLQVILGFGEVAKWVRENRPHVYQMVAVQEFPGATALGDYAAEKTVRLDAQVSSDHAPPEIKESLQRFRSDYPEPRKVAFIMMQLSHSKAHREIAEGVRGGLKPFGVAGVRADEKQYHDDLLSNVLTYVFGCGLGVAIFERIEGEEFNPNVALEVGYMFALRKPVCLLKDRTLKALHTDLVGKLYRVFDPQDPIATIPRELSRWFTDKDLHKGT